MVKHIQTIRWQQPTNCLSMFEHFVGLALKELNKKICVIIIILILGKGIDLQILTHNTLTVVRLFTLISKKVKAMVKIIPRIMEYHLLLLIMTTNS